MPNGVIQSASEYFNDTEKYPGNRGTDTNPFVIADYKDLIGMNSYVYKKQNYTESSNLDTDYGGGSYLLVNDIDCNEWDPNKNGPIVLRAISKSTTVIDFNGYSMYNIIVRSFNGKTVAGLSKGDDPGSCFLNLKFPCTNNKYNSGYMNRIIKNMSFKNVIFHNSRNFQLIGFSINFAYIDTSSYNPTPKIFFENPSFEVYISEDGVKSSNETCTLFPDINQWADSNSSTGTKNDSDYILKYTAYVKNIYLKLSGREVMRSLSKMKSPDNYKKSCVYYLFGFNPAEQCRFYVTDMTLNYNDFVFVINEGYGTYGDYKAPGMAKVYNCYSLAPAARSIDTINIIGNMTIRVPKGSSSTDSATSTIDPVYPIQFFRSSEYNTDSPDTRFSMLYSNILFNANVDIVVDDNNSSCAIFDCTDVTYFVNKDRYLLSTVSTGTLNGNYKVFNRFQKAVECTTEQVNDAEYMKNQGLVVFNLNT